jgi:hypothetical protein
MSNDQDEPMDQEAIYAIAHLAGQAASELKALDKLALGSSPNMKGLQYDPQELIRKNFLSRMQSNGAPPASANPNQRMHAPAPEPHHQQHHQPQQIMQQPPQQQPQQMMQPQPRQQAPQVFAGISNNISEAQISLLMEKLLRVERLLDACVSGQDKLQVTLDRSLEKLLQKKMKDIKITFKDDNIDSQQE